MEEEKILLEIIKNYIKNPKKVIKSKNIDEERLYKIAKKNKVSNFLKTWANETCKSEKIKNKVQMDFNSQIIKDTNERIEEKAVLDEFEKQNIETIVLKGIIMKDIYPQNYMRKMCDMDILIHYKDFEQASKKIKKMGYKEHLDHKKHKNDHHLVFLKEPFFDIELHRRLIHKDNDTYEYFKQIWSRVVKYKDYKNIYQMDIEETYIFCIVHLLKHFKNSGINIRDILDVYLYNEKYKNEINYEKLNKILEKYKIKKFEKDIKKMAYKWFGEKEIKEFSKIEKYILEGRSQNIQLNSIINKSGGKNKSIIRMFFPKLKYMKEPYPILEKIPILLPVMWIIRIIIKIFDKEVKNTERIKRVKKIKEFDEEKVKELQTIYKELGL